MKKDVFLKKLDDKILLFDGAMGTMLYAKGVYINRCFDELNLSKPNIVKEIHQTYLQCGVDCIETNTFGANWYKLSAHGFGSKLYDINFQGAKLAKEAAGSDILVAGSIGPLGIKIEPWGPTSKEEARKAFRDQGQALLDGGVDLFILETFSDLRSIEQAIAGLKDICDLPVIASMTIAEEGKSLYGTSLSNIAAELEAYQVDVIGLNCSVGPRIMLEALEELAKITAKPISVMPNAGFPEAVEGRNIYLASAEYMAEYTRRFIHAGAKIVGGCCGTSPDHIKAMGGMIRSITPHRPLLIREELPKMEKMVAKIPTAEKSDLARKLCSGDFVTSVEIVPPRGCDPTKVLESVRFLKENGIDAINIPYGPRALSRMSAQHLSVLIRQQVGIEPILHYACRDRNLLGMMSDMLGLYAMGIRNLLIITGDPPKMGDYPDATAVFDIDSIGLINMVNQLNQGSDMGGNSIGMPTGYLIGVGLNPSATDPEKEMSRFEWKVKAGADYAITQPVFDYRILLEFLDKIKPVKIPIIAGIWPLISLRNAEFMNNEMPGTSVPDEIMERMRASKTKQDAMAEGIQIAREILAKIKDHVQGVQVSAPFGKVKYALEVLRDL